ncbi:MAG TPA: glycosyltransferase family 4 protein [Chloroflexota bacterium]|nr:glycosyltransferase family 4 protein [Chloroflexota bacterium]
MTTAARPLRIAQIAPPSIPCPPEGYGASELVAGTLTEELVRRGHDVTLFAHPESITKATHVFFPPVYELQDAERRELAHTALVFDRATEFDVIHNHCIQPGPAAIHAAAGALTTLHYIRPLLRTFATHPYVALSESQRRANPDLNIIGVAQNGIEPTNFMFQAVKNDYLLWIGRIDPKKGPHLAIEIARRLDANLFLAAGYPSRDNIRYWEAQVKPRLGGKVEYLGHVVGAEKRNLFAGARCVLMPHQWEEPFGLVAIEAMASGTPVIALRRGALPEIVRHGETGFVVDTVDEMVDAVSRLDSIDPCACRRLVEERFSAAAMADAYLAVYDRLLTAPPISPREGTTKHPENVIERAS